MKNSQRLRALLLVSVLTASGAQAGDPQPQPAPDVQALIALLNKLVAEAAASAETPAAAEPAPVLPSTFSTPAAAATAPTPVVKAAPTPPPSALRTSSLSTSSLTGSGPLGGSGTATPLRLSNEDWRALFTARPLTK